MKIVKPLLLIVVTAALLGSLPALGRPFTPRDLVMLSHIADPAVSADGRWLIWDQSETDLAVNTRRHELWRLDLSHAGALPERLAALRGAGAGAPVFGADGRVYFLSELQDGNTAVWSIATTGGSPLQVTGDYALSGFALSPRGDAILVWADRPAGARSLADVGQPARRGRGNVRVYDHLFVRHWDTWSDGRRSQLFVLPFAAGRARGAGHAIEGPLVGDTPSKPMGGSEEIAWSKDGRRVYFVLRQAGPDEALSENFDIFAAPADGSTPPVNLTADNPAIDTLPAVSPDGRWLAWVATARAGYEDDRKVLVLRNLASGETRRLTQQWDRSIDSIAWAGDSGSLYVTAVDRLDHPAFRIDVRKGEVQRLTGAGHVSGITPLPQGGFIYLLDTLTAPGDLWRLDLRGTAARLTAVNGARLGGISWPVVRRFAFRGAGGDTVWGLAMRPTDSVGARSPVALFVHGGPQGTLGDAWSDRVNLAAWAGRGYAGVSVDFHGSIGYGQAFTDSINNDWGGKPLTDLELGLQAAIQRFSFLNAEDVCGVGGSYGGYMMNWIEGHWPHRFRCLIQDDGIFDVRAMAYETDELWADRWDHGGKLYFQAPAAYEKWNPVDAVAAWSTPQLVITGEKDFRSPSTQAVAAFTALQLRGVPSRLLVFPDEGHWVQNPADRLRWYGEVFRWMDHWTRPPSKKR